MPIWNASMNLHEKLPWRRSRTSERQCVDEFVTYSMASDYYGLGLKLFTLMAHVCWASFKSGRIILIRRSILDEYLRQQRKI